MGHLLSAKPPAVAPIDSGDLDRLRAAGGVDADWYRHTYPDIGDYLDPVEHYAWHGWREGRSPNADFSVEWYVARNPDVAAAGLDPFLHFLRTGRAQGRRHAPHDYWQPEAWTWKHGGVDPAFYAARTPPAESEIEPATHYATLGWRQRRDPSAAFSTAWYLATNPDIAAAGIDPLHHYLVHGQAEGRSPKPSLFDAIRFHEWWSHKFPVFLAVGYATALVLDVSIVAIWPALLVGVVALAVSAAYVSIINDWSDRAVDALGGKPNRMAARSPRAAALMVAACLVPGAAFAFVWRHDPLVLALYLGTWVAFSLYSLPPARLKYRGILGPLCDAVGAHLCPTLLVGVLVVRFLGAPLDWTWLAPLGLWALGCGLRGILWHQRSDAAHDAKAGMSTFARRIGLARLRRFETRIVLPIEAAALVVLLSRATILALALVAIAAAFELWRAIRVPKRRLPARPGPPALFAIYEVQLPLSLLAASAVGHPEVLLVAIAHVALFARRYLRLGAWRAATPATAPTTGTARRGISTLWPRPRLVRGAS